MPALQDRPPASGRWFALAEPRSSDKLNRRENSGMSLQRDIGGWLTRQVRRDFRCRRSRICWGEGGGSASSSASKMRGGYSSGCFTSGSSYSASTVGDCAAGAVAGASPGSGNPASTTNTEDVEMTYLCSLLKDVIKKGKFTKVTEIVSLQKPSSSCWTTDILRFQWVWLQRDQTGTHGLAKIHCKPDADAGR